MYFDTDSFIGLGFYLKCSIDQSCSFSHAEQSQAIILLTLRLRKSSPIISNGQDQFICTFSELYFNPIRATMLDGISQAFLGNTIKTQAHLLWYRVINIFRTEFDNQI